MDTTTSIAIVLVVASNNSLNFKSALWHYIANNTYAQLSKYKNILEIGLLFRIFQKIETEELSKTSICTYTWVMQQICMLHTVIQCFKVSKTLTIKTRADIHFES